jgi:hypothetical protein
MTVVIRKSFDKENLSKALGSLKKRGKFNSRKYCGVITLKKTPLAIQKTMRDEWS